MFPTSSYCCISHCMLLEYGLEFISVGECMKNYYGGERVDLQRLMIQTIHFILLIQQKWKWLCTIFGIDCSCLNCKTETVEVSEK